MRPADQFPTSSLPTGPAGEHLPLAVLRQYAAGTLAAAEQHRVERHTLACTRCADVLEGLSQTDAATTDRALAELQTRLHARVAEAPKTERPSAAPWVGRQLAAAVLLLLLGAGLWLGLRRPGEGLADAPPVAAVRRAARPAPVAVPAEAPTLQIETFENKEVGQAIAAAPPVATTPTQRPARARRLPAQPAPKTLVSPDAAAKSGTAAADISMPLTTDSTVVAFNSKPRPAKYPARTPTVAQAAPATAKGRLSAVATVAEAKAATADTRTVRGRVTDGPSGRGLGGVLVRAKGSNTSASTAPDGSFTLTAPASDTAISINYSGYAATEQTLVNSTASQPLTLALTPTRTANEVLVRREAPPAAASIGALPAGGYPALRNYLRDSLDYPEKALKDEKEGTVRLSFVVAADGSLQDIKVVRGLSEECDAEAIRLLREGPRWYPAIVNGRRTARTVQVSVPFKISATRP